MMEYWDSLEGDLPKLRPKNDLLEEGAWFIGELDVLWMWWMFSEEGEEKLSKLWCTSWETFEEET